MSKYLFIYEGQRVRQGDTLKTEHIAACREGILDIIDISGPAPMEYECPWWSEVLDDD